MTARSFCVAVGMTAALAAGCDQGPSDLLGRTFRSTAVTEEGAPRPLVPGTRITLTFDERAGKPRIGWKAGCNSAGGDVRISAERITVRRVASTLIGCPRPLGEQDAWLNEFFEADPGWLLIGDRLLLTSGETTIELE